MYNASNTLITEGDVAVCIGGVFVCVWNTTEAEYILYGYTFIVL